jgi:hypothetical protein
LTRQILRSLGGELTVMIMAPKVFARVFDNLYQ